LPRRRKVAAPTGNAVFGRTLARIAQGGFELCRDRR